MSSRLIILIGTSGSGKTSIAYTLRHEMGYGTMVIVHGVVRREIIRVRDTPGNPSIQAIADLAMYGKQIGYDVIIEGILAKDKYGDMLRELIQNFGGKTSAYYFDLTFGETLARHKTKPNRAEFGEKEMREWWCEKDQLGMPGELIIDSSQSQAQILAMIMADIDAQIKPL